MLLLLLGLVEARVNRVPFHQFQFDSKEPQNEFGKDYAEHIGEHIAVDYTEDYVEAYHHDSVSKASEGDDYEYIDEDSFRSGALDPDEVGKFQE